ncbi:MAG TPA: ribosome recycling factor, partial [Dehalococcoidia bacterium]
MVQEQLDDAKSRMHGAVEALQHELAAVRTGRASVGLVEHVKVDYYGTSTPLNQLATISTPDPKMILIQPYDKGAVGDIEKSLLKSDIGLTPSNDGQVIRLTIPPLTEERRKELAKQVRARVEDARVAVRNVRRD